MKIVFHSHAAPGKIHPGKAHTANVSFVKNDKYKYEIMEIDHASLKTLHANASEVK